MLKASIINYFNCGENNLVVNVENRITYTYSTYTYSVLQISVGTRDTQLETGTIPDKPGRLVTVLVVHSLLALSFSKCSYADIDEPLGERQTMIDKTGEQAINIFLNNFMEKQAVSMMPVNHVQSLVCHGTVLTDTGSRLWSVIVNEHFLNVTHSPFLKLQLAGLRTVDLA